MTSEDGEWLSARINEWSRDSDLGKERRKSRFTSLAKL